MSYLKTELGFGGNTVVGYGSDINQFRSYLETSKKQKSLESFTTKDVADFLLSLAKEKKSTATVLRFLSALQSYVDYLLREGHRKDDPLELIQRPRLWKDLPGVLTEDEVQQLFESIDVGTTLGLRDRALYEMMYSLGLRVSEVIQLTLSSVHREERLVRVQGKGEKTRLVPIQENSLHWVLMYLERARPAWARRTSSGVATLFLNRSGKKLTRQAVWKKLALYGRKAGLKQTLHPHILRHSIATHLLQRGADLRSVQAFLGHAQAASTQIYTHVLPSQILASYKRHHPRA